MRSVAFRGVVGAVFLVGCSSGNDSPAPGQGGASANAGTPSSAGGAGSPSSSAGSSTQGGNAPTAGSTQGGASGTQGGNGTTAGSSSGGSAGATATNGGASTCGTATPLSPPTPSACPAAAGNTPPDMALTAVNELRSHMGLSCMTLVTELNTSSQKHCDYYQQNMADKVCIANAHAEVATCAGFVAEMFFARMTSAGYKGSARSEVMAFSGNPTSAIAQWINSVYHRTPLLSPWIADMGYGMTADCDTIDMGQGVKAADTVTAVYPYPGQIDVPINFDGSHEGPMPPAPPSGWPSASPVHIYAKNYSVTSHDIYVSGTCSSLPHQWLPDKEQYILYPDKPFAKGTEYRVVVVGTRGAAPLSFDWTFKTKN
jgi:hypothetical protein